VSNRFSVCLGLTFISLPTELSYEKLSSECKLSTFTRATLVAPVAGPSSSLDEELFSYFPYSSLNSSGTFSLLSLTIYFFSSSTASTAGLFFKDNDVYSFRMT
jgi:hypothetical protein